MKKRKLSCFLALAMCLTVPLAACDKDEDATSALNEHFYWENARTAYSTVTRYDGDVVDYDKDHNIAVIRSKEVSTTGAEVDKVEVIDLLTGDKINEFIATNPVGTEEQAKKTVEVDIEYPVIRVKKNSPYFKSGSDDEPGYWKDDIDYSYYWAKSPNATNTNSNWNYWDNNTGTYSGYEIEYGVENDSLKVIEHYGLYEVKASHKVFWVNEDLETLREFNKAQTDGYLTTSLGKTVFDGCYDDYLYSWTFTQASRMIQVYNREGVCSMQYTFPSDVVSLGAIGAPVILNNGNLLVQEYTLADKDSADYTYQMLAYNGNGPEMTKFNVTSKIIDYKTGEAKVVELDYILNRLEAAYMEATPDEYGFPFEVREKGQNQAYISKIVNKETKTVDYVTLDNNGKITYTVNNEYVRGQGTWSYIEKINDTQYATAVYAEGRAQYWVFDANGKKVAVLPETTDEFTKDYLVTEFGIYNYSRKCLYDFETSPFYTQDTYEDVELVVMGDRVCISTNNLLTCEYEWYEFNGKTFVKAEGTFEYAAQDSGYLPKGNTATVEVVVGNDFDLEGVDSYTWTLYKKDGTPLLRKQIEKNELGQQVLTMCEDVAFVEVEVDGETVVYVVK